MIHLAWIAPLLFLVFLLGSPRFRGDIAERRVRRILAVGLERSRYTVFNDLLVPFGGGTVRIDHVVVSKSGIFVIESEYAPGVVAGTAVQERWKRKRLGRIHRLDNPVHRNRVQAEALAAAIALVASVTMLREGGESVPTVASVDSASESAPVEVVSVDAFDVDELMVVESYAHVHHIVSNVRGRLRADVLPGDAIRAVFPGGTITGCPKVRCMEIIAELEGRARGPYTGAMGYLNRDGSLDLNILIRTVHVAGRDVRFPAGGGIVVDSPPGPELEETRAKARGLRLALEGAG